MLFTVKQYEVAPLLLHVKDVFLSGWTMRAPEAMPALEKAMLVPKKSAPIPPTAAPLTMSFTIFDPPRDREENAPLTPP